MEAAEQINALGSTGAATDVWDLGKLLKAGKEFPWLPQALRECQGGLLAGGIVMVSAGLVAIGIGAVGAGVAIGLGIEGIHGASAAALPIVAGGLLEGFGGLTIKDACFGGNSRLGLRH